MDRMTIAANQEADRVAIDRLAKENSLARIQKALLLLENVETIINWCAAGKPHDLRKVRLEFSDYYLNIETPEQTHRNSMSFNAESNNDQVVWDQQDDPIALIISGASQLAGKLPKMEGE